MDWLWKSVPKPRWSGLWEKESGSGFCRHTGKLLPTSRFIPQVFSIYPVTPMSVVGVFGPNFGSSEVEKDGWFENPNYQCSIPKDPWMVYLPTFSCFCIYPQAPSFATDKIPHGPKLLTQLSGFRVQRYLLCRQHLGGIIQSTATRHWRSAANPSAFRVKKCRDNVW